MNSSATTSRRHSRSAVQHYILQDGDGSEKTHVENAMNEADVLVIFGVTGDLAKKMTFLPSTTWSVGRCSSASTPSRVLAAHSYALDQAYRDFVGTMFANSAASIDERGELHAKLRVHNRPPETRGGDLRDGPARGIDGTAAVALAGPL
jgi:hypothetical protein